jgi:hypothetical protein
MGRSRIAEWAAITAAFATGNSLPAAPTRTSPVRSEKAACLSAKRVIAGKGRFPVSAIAFCDFVVPERRPRGYYVLGLHSKRDDCGPDGICGSTLMGWFAIEKSTGRVFEFDLEEWRPGRFVGL